jgi:hypothetical protein
MQNVAMKIGGSVSYWSIGGRTDRQKLIDGLKAAGFENHNPDPRTPYSALQLALAEVFGNATTLVRPLAKKAGFAVVNETRGNEKTGNEYETLVTATLPPVGQIGLPNLDPPIKVVEVLTAYATSMAQVPSGSVATCLTKIVAALGGVPLREAGGVYWVPQASMAQFRQVVAAVEAADPDGKNRVSVMTAVFDESTVRAVADGLRAEVEAEAKRLSEEILSGELGDKAIESRTAEAVSLKKKVERYEADLGILLGGLHEALDTVTLAAATGTMKAAAAASALTEDAGLALAVA